MKTYQRFCRRFLPIVLLLTFLAGSANAALQSVGPVDPVTTIPAWYRDTNNLALMPCLDQNGFCLLTPNFDPAAAPATRTPPGAGLSTITTTGPINDGNLPDEAFYYSAAASLPIEAGELANLAFALEFAFLSGVIPDGGIVFLRTNLQKMQNLAPSSTYRVTHPYGTFDFTTDVAGNTTGGGGVAVRLEDISGTPANFLPPLMKSAAITNIGPFLTPASGILPTALVGAETHTYIGDGATPIAVTGSPTGNNFFRIDRLNPDQSVAATWQTNSFVLMGRVFTAQIPSPTTIDRATYARDAVSEQIDVFATALPSAVLSISGTNLAATTLTQDASTPGKFFAHLPGGALPTGVSITNSLDIPSILYPVTLVDEINISLAYYNPVTRDLTIKAVSRDKAAPPVLTVPALALPNTLNATTGMLVKTLPANAIPPMTVQVVSSHLGSATAPVSVVIPPAPPVALDDTAQTNNITPVTVSVLGNDTAAGTIDPTSVVIGGQTNGTASANPNGTVTFTPAAAFTGQASFTYTVSDMLGQLSNVATVTVTVTSPVAPPATGITLFSTVASPQVAGAAVSFNGAATGGSGSYEYQYWLKDTSGVYSLVQPYSASPTWNWNTTGLLAGTYSIAAQARSVGSTTPGFDAETVKDFFIIAGLGANIPATAVNITTNLASPQAAGAPVTFTGTASGGSGFYEYQFWLKDTTGVYTLVQPFSASQSWTWNTTGAVVGDYTVAVQARSTGTNPPTGFDVERTAPFSIQ